MFGCGWFLFFNVHFKRVFEAIQGHKSKQMLTVIVKWTFSTGELTVYSLFGGRKWLDEMLFGEVYALES